MWDVCRPRTGKMGRDSKRSIEVAHLKLPQLVYDCDNCGLCCKQAIVWGTVIDTMREPRIRTEARRVKIDGVPEDRWLLNRMEGDAPCGPCVFHTGEKCGIYASRPNVCAGFAAGGADCQALRAENGLQPLVPRTEEIEEAYVVLERADLPPTPEAGTLAPTPQEAANSAANG